MIGLTTFVFPFAFPAKQEPTWAALVDRWSQLDAAAYGLALAYSQLQNQLGENPRWVLLASRGASNETDRQFVMSGARSPSKFVHTLPNIRSSALLRLMGWTGPVLCLQKDPCTWATALIEATTLLQVSPGPVWIAGLTQHHQERQAVFLILHPENRSAPFQLQKNGDSRPQIPTDEELFRNLAGNASQSRFSLAEAWEIVKSAPLGG